MATNRLVRVIGLDQFKDKMELKKAKAAHGFEVGAHKAGLMLQAAAQESVPVKTGELKSSGYTKVEGAGFDTVVSVGFSAPYAAAVHEKTGMVLASKPRPKGQGSYWDPQGQAKAHFLEDNFVDLRDQMLNVIKTEVVTQMNS